MTRPPVPGIRCAGCGIIHPTELIRCPECETLTRASQDYWRTRVPPIDGQIRWGCVITLAAIFWAMIGAAIWAGHG